MHGMTVRPTLVTGANGHLGNNVCRLLVERGERVRALIRAAADPAPLDGLDVELVRGDILDADAVAAAVDGCGRVYHMAAGFRLWSRHPERDVVRPTVDGTRHLMAAAARHGVERVVYTSTLGTIGFAASPERVPDERWTNDAPHTHYVAAKIAAERAAFEAGARAGVEVVSIHPGLILGPRFWRVSESVRLVAEFVEKGAPAYTDGGFGVVDVEDVARGALLAMDGGRSGERYILSGDNLSVRALFTLMGELTGLRPPAIRLPVPVVRAAAVLLEVGAALTRGRPMLDRRQVAEFTGKYVWADSGKAARELGYTWRPARAALERTIAWLVERGFVSPRRLRSLEAAAAWRWPRTRAS